MKESIIQLKTLRIKDRLHFNSTAQQKIEYSMPGSDNQRDSALQCKILDKKYHIWTNPKKTFNRSSLASIKPVCQEDHGQKLDFRSKS